MYHGLGVHDHLDRRVGQPEQEVRLDHLERLVDQRRGIHRDLLAHFPRGVLQRLDHRRTGESLRRPGPERPARRREDEAGELTGPAAGDALQHGAVLGIDGHDLPAPHACGLGDELSRHHERFLVGERHALAGAQRGERRLEARRADDRVDDDPHVRVRRRFDQAAGSTLVSRFPVPGIHEPHVRRPPFRGLILEQLRVRVRGQRHHAEPLALAPQHLQGGRADRSGGAEDGDAAGHTTPNSLKSPAVTGTTKYSESSRSSTPP